MKRELRTASDRLQRAIGHLTSQVSEHIVEPTDDPILEAVLLLCHAQEDILIESLAATIATHTGTGMRTIKNGG